MSIITAITRGAEYLNQSPDATPIIMIPTIIIRRDHQYPSFDIDIRLLRVPLNLSAIPMSANGMTKMLYEAVPQFALSHGDSGGMFNSAGSPKSTLVNQ